MPSPIAAPRVRVRPRRRCPVACARRRSGAPSRRARQSRRHGISGGRAWPLRPGAVPWRTRIARVGSAQWRSRRRVPTVRALSIQKFRAVPGAIRVRSGCVARYRAMRRRDAQCEHECCGVLGKLVWCVLAHARRGLRVTAGRLRTEACGVQCAQTPSERSASVWCVLAHARRGLRAHHAC